MRQHGDIKAGDWFVIVVFIPLLLAVMAAGVAVVVAGMAADTTKAAGVAAASKAAGSTKERITILATRREYNHVLQPVTEREWLAARVVRALRLVRR